MVRVNKRHPITGKQQTAIDFGDYYKFADGTLIDKVQYYHVEKLVNEFENESKQNETLTIKTHY